MNRDLEQARKAYQENDLDLARKAHDQPENIGLTSDQKSHSEEHGGGGDWIKSAVFGGTDGMVTVYCVVMGAAGAALSAKIVLAMSIATLFSDGIVMAFGDFLGTKSEIEFQKQERQREKWEIENCPENEKLEMLEIYQQKGMDPKDAQDMVDILEKNQDTWLDVMMAEELGLIATDQSPAQNGLITFFSFCIFGIVPAIPFIVGYIADTNEKLFEISTGLTLFFFGVLGFIQSFFVHVPWYKGALETMIVGGISAAIAYLIGLAFQPVTNGAKANG